MNYSYWLALSSAEYLSNKEKYMLIEEFGSARGIFTSSYSRIKESHIIRPQKIDRLMNTDMRLLNPDRFAKDDIQLCCIDAADYPLNLKNIYAPPVLLYYRGILPDKPCISVVGSRKTTAAGRQNAFEISAALSEKGFCIVSGMARGIDSSAHLGALDKGTTAAVLGSGINICYPPENDGLMKRIANNGCIISEFVPDRNPSRYTFPARNRIISGMSEAVIIVEAAAKSGALITADFALDQGREIFAFKNIVSDYSQGTENLIKEGAIPVNSVKEFMELYT